MEKRPDVDVALIEAEEDLVIDAQFLIQDLLNRKGLSRSELAKQTGLSKARLSQLMGSEANPTLKTVARILHALGVRGHLSVASAEVNTGEKQSSAPKDDSFIRVLKAAMDDALALDWDDLVLVGEIKTSGRHFRKGQLETLLKLKAHAAETSEPSNDNFFRARTLKELETEAA